MAEEEFNNQFSVSSSIFYGKLFSEEKQQQIIKLLTHEEKKEDKNRNGSQSIKSPSELVKNVKIRMNQKKKIKQKIFHRTKELPFFYPELINSKRKKTSPNVDLIQIKRKVGHPIKKLKKSWRKKEERKN